jgi:hypothetical protein
MANIVCGIDNIASVLTDELQKYSDEVADEVKQACRDVSKEMTDNIKADSQRLFKGTGKYAKGWKAKVSYEDKNNIRLTTYNSTEPQLTHLLEYGHAKVNGGRVEGKPHISPNEEKAKRELTERIEKKVQK